MAGAQVERSGLLFEKVDPKLAPAASPGRTVKWHVVKWRHDPISFIRRMNSLRCSAFGITMSYMGIMITVLRNRVFTGNESSNL